MLELDLGTSLKWMRLMSIFPPHMDRLPLLLVERDMMMRSRSEAACEF